MVVEKLLVLRLLFTLNILICGLPTPQMYICILRLVDICALFLYYFKFAICCQLRTNGKSVFFFTFLHRITYQFNRRKLINSVLTAFVKIHKDTYGRLSVWYYNCARERLKSDVVSWEIIFHFANICSFIGIYNMWCVCVCYWTDGNIV